MSKKKGPTNVELVAKLVEREAKIVASYGRLTDYWMTTITRAELIKYIEEVLPEKAAMGLVEG